MREGKKEQGRGYDYKSLLIMFCLLASGLSKPLFAFLFFPDDFYGSFTPLIALEWGAIGTVKSQASHALPTKWPHHSIQAGTWLSFVNFPALLRPLAKIPLDPNDWVSKEMDGVSRPFLILLLSLDPSRSRFLKDYEGERDVKLTLCFQVMAKVVVRDLPSQNVE